MKVQTLLKSTVVLVGVSLAGMNAACAADYVFTDLGVLFGGSNSSSSALAINNFGQIVGSSELQVNTWTEQHAVRWDSGIIRDLGVLGTGRTSVATDINNAGTIVGYSKLDTSSETTHAVKWVNNVGTDISALGVSNSRAFAINESGQIIGSDSGARGTTKPQTMLWEGNTSTNLGALHLGNVSEGRGINNFGVVAGLSNTTTDVFGTKLATKWIGTAETGLGYGLSGGSAANDVNDAGQIVGFARVGSGLSAYFEAAVWGVDSSFTTLASLGGNGSIANSINAAGQIVGYATNASRSPRATLWENGKAIDLNDLVDSDWVLRTAWDINDKGWIVGDAFSFATGQTHAFLLSTAPVPEPETYAMLLAGLGLLGLTAKRRRQKQNA